MKRPEKSSERSPIERGCDTMKVADAPFYEYYHHFHSRRHSSAKPNLFSHYFGTSITSIASSNDIL